VVIDPRHFAALEMRAGTILSAQPFPQARKPSYKLVVDFGREIGRKQSSAAVTNLYSCEDLVGMQVVAAVNLGTKRIAGFESEVLVLGVPDASGNVVLLIPQRRVQDGARVF
jgi:tRNA-binding protein